MIFPPKRTPLPDQANIRIYIFFSFLIVFLAVFCVYGFSRNANVSSSIPEKFYVKAEKQEGWAEKFFGDPVAIFTLVLTGATIGLYIATRGLWVATERLVRETEETSRRQFRAYVYCNSVEFSIPSDNSANWSIHVDIRNFGKTPAYKVIVKTGFSILDIGLNNIVIDTDEGNTAVFPEIIIAPDRNIVSRIPLNINNWEDMLKFVAKDDRFFVVGQVDYVDAFGNRHFSKFQFVHHREIIHQFALCTVGNGTDDVISENEA